MRARLVVCLAMAGALVAMGTAGHAATPVLDGKKLKKIEFKGNGAMGSNDTDLLLSDTETRMKCKPPRCIRQDFVFKPAKGIKGGALFRIKWPSSPANDMDLFVTDSAGTNLGSCGGSTGDREWVYIAEGVLKTGKTYTAIADFYRSVPSNSVTGTIEFPAKAPAAGPVPNTPLPLFEIGLDDILLYNCTT